MATTDNSPPSRLRVSQNHVSAIPPVPSVHSLFRTFAVTGTNGKTSTTRFLRALLSRPGCPVAEVSTLGFFLGDEEMAFRQSFGGFVEHLDECAAAGARFAAIEYTSEALARRFAEVWSPHAAIFTNLTRDHLDAHPSWEHYLASKAQLFTNLPDNGAAVLNDDSPMAPFIAEVCSTPRVFRTSVRSTSDAAVRARVVSQSLRGSRVEVLNWPKELADKLEARSFFVGLPGDVFASNALQAVTCVAAGGVEVDAHALAALAKCRIPGRFEIVNESPNVIVDFAHSPDAVARMLDTTRPLTQGQTVVVLGAGGQRDKGKRPEMGSACESADHVLITSDNARTEKAESIAEAIASGVPRDVEVEIVVDRAQAIQRAVSRLSADDTLLILGRGADTTLSIDGETLRLDDREVARQALQSRGTA